MSSLKSEKNRPLVIVIAGLIKSRKSTFARFASKMLDFPLLELSDVIRETLPKDYSLEDIIINIEEIRRKHGPDALAKEMEHKLERSSIVCGLRSIADYRYLSKHFSTVTIFIHSPKSIRYDRLRRDEKSLAKNISDYENTDKLAIREGIYSVAQLANFTLINDPEFPISPFNQLYLICKNIIDEYNLKVKLSNQGFAMNSKGYELSSLNIYSSSKDAENDVVSRIIKPKGELATLSIDESNFIAFVEFPLDGEPRANHYHEEKLEFLYLIKGKVKLFIRKGGHEELAPTELIVNAGDLVKIYPGFAHAYITIEEGHAIEFSPASHDVIKRDKIRDYVIRQ